MEVTVSRGKNVKKVVRKLINKRYHILQRTYQEKIMITQPGLIPKRILYLVGGLWLMLGSFCLCVAESDQQSALEPGTLSYTEEITVIASPIVEEQGISSYGASTATVTQQQIDDLKALDLPTALRRVPSVEISRHNLVGYGFGTPRGRDIRVH
jgi:hypothetical protein